jgi:hypothetical protein
VETERSGGGTGEVVEKLGAVAFFWRQRLSMMMCGTVACTSLRRSCGGCWATRWGSGAHRAATWHEGCGGGRCSGTPRRRRCSSGRPWLGGGPTTPEEEGNTTSIFRQRRMAALTIEGVWRWLPRRNSGEGNSSGRRQHGQMVSRSRGGGDGVLGCGRAGAEESSGVKHSGVRWATFVQRRKRKWQGVR